MNVVVDPRVLVALDELDRPLSISFRRFREAFLGPQADDVFLVAVMPDHQDPEAGPRGQPGGRATQLARKNTPVGFVESLPVSS